MAGNYVTDDEAEMLMGRINALATSSDEELRQMYRDKLREPVEATSKGASLGLIEIARRASLPLTCEAIKDNSGHNLFMIKATV